MREGEREREEEEEEVRGKWKRRNITGTFE